MVTFSRPCRTAYFSSIPYQETPFIKNSPHEDEPPDDDDERHSTKRPVWQRKSTGIAGGGAGGAGGGVVEGSEQYSAKPHVAQFTACFVQKPPFAHHRHASHAFASRSAQQPQPGGAAVRVDAAAGVAAEILLAGASVSFAHSLHPAQRLS